MAVIDAIKDEVETVFHPIPKHHKSRHPNEEEIIEKTSSSTPKGRPSAQLEKQLYYPKNVWDEIRNGYVIY